jgi:hypothetical protein
MTNVNDDSRVVNKLETSLTDDARVFIYDRHVFIVQATELISLDSINAIFRPMLNIINYLSSASGSCIRTHELRIISLSREP